MKDRYITEECNKILDFWKLEEYDYFTPRDPGLSFAQTH